MIEMPGLRFAVLQPGARMHYAVPALLERAGMLQRFYTDCCASIGLLRYAGDVWPARLRPKVIRRMFGRILPPDIPTEKVRQALPETLAGALLQRAGITVSTAAPLVRRAVSEEFGGANAIYSVLGNEDLELFAKAKDLGLCVVHEAMSSPDAALAARHEYERFPVSQQPPLSMTQIEARRHRDKLKYELADLILAPSNFVYTAVRELGADPQKIKIVPYGIDESWLGIPQQTIPGNVLFIGRVSLMKGCHYLAEAARLLKARRVPCKVRAVGPLARSLRDHSLFAGPTYVGQVPRSQIRIEYARADLLVLPSLSEGMATVTLEALASGVPVVTTPNAGSCVRDGIDGLIVPVRDAEALADAIEHIVTDRDFRAMLSANARQRARYFTWSQYGDRLIDALSTLKSGRLGATTEAVEALSADQLS